MYSREEDMYPDIRSWLERELKSHMVKASLIRVYISSRTSVANLLKREGLAQYFPSEFLSYDIKVDITGVVVKQGRGALAFVECKLNKISLKDFSQLLGYSVVAKPLYSLILSPRGIADSLRTLITSFGRMDILRYTDEREIAIAKWDENRKDIDYMTIIPPGWSFRRGVLESK